MWSTCFIDMICRRCRRHRRHHYRAHHRTEMDTNFFSIATYTDCLFRIFSRKVLSVVCECVCVFFFSIAHSNASPSRCVDFACTNCCVWCALVFFFLLLVLFAVTQLFVWFLTSAVNRLHGRLIRCSCCILSSRSPPTFAPTYLCTFICKCKHFMLSYRCHTTWHFNFSSTNQLDQSHRSFFLSTCSPATNRPSVQMFWLNWKRESDLVFQCGRQWILCVYVCKIKSFSLSLPATALVGNASGSLGDIETFFIPFE